MLNDEVFLLTLSVFSVAKCYFLFFWFYFVSLYKNYKKIKERRCTPMRIKLWCYNKNTGSICFLSACGGLFSFPEQNQTQLTQLYRHLKKNKDVRACVSARVVDLCGCWVKYCYIPELIKHRCPDAEPAERLITNKTYLMECGGVGGGGNQ